MHACFSRFKVGLKDLKVLITLRRISVFHNKQDQKCVSEITLDL